ncbi:MAG: hypothetical protein K2X74_05460 [Acetobacteraceae bacterium]|nr:hypothetical protein [Acetobacteraceae bacterium]
MRQAEDAMVTYLTEAVDPRPEAGDGLRVGHPIRLRVAPQGPVVEAWSPEHGRLGRLPPPEGEALAPLLRTGLTTVTGWVSALVPRSGSLGGTRIHIRLEGV